jgi:hypothetical protein
MFLSKTSDYFALYRFVRSLRLKILTISAQHDNYCCLLGDALYIDQNATFAQILSKYAI